MNSQNQSWDLTSFLEALYAELDRARDLLRVKAVNRPLTYAVQDLSLGLNVFAEYDGDVVHFRTAQPNEEGASKLEFKLGSVTDRIVVETTKPPPLVGDVLVDDVPLDDKTRRSLKKIGVESKQDVEKLAQRKVKLRTREGEDMDFGRLAALMERATSPARRPRIEHVVSASTPAGTRVRMIGEGLQTIAPDRVCFNGQAVQASVGPNHADLLLPAHGANGDLLIETVSGEQIRVHLVE